MIKIGVVSDTHLTSGAALPKRLLEALSNVDLIIHAGDLVELSVLADLEKIGPEVRAVWGNMDSAQVKQTLPEFQVFKAGQFSIGLTHGLGGPFNLMEMVKEKFKKEKVDCIVYGHSHQPKNELHQQILYFNPGSPTDKFFAPYNSYGILQIDKEIIGEIIKI